ncbi:MAG: right-handed parallel beta-helix repeat-containing protein [Chloroflexota bacterium]
MDGQAFDRLARALGGAMTRRGSLRAAAGGALAAGAAASLAAKHRRRKPGAEGPCGDGTRKQNICMKDSECCTNICNRKTGKRNKDEKGRCRCIRRGGPCKENRNCCNTLTCGGGICGGGAPDPTPTPSPIPDVCEVCASGCPYSTVAAAIAAASAGAIITIDNGTYNEDLTIDKDLTLKNCNGSAPVLRNLTAGGRTITFTATAAPWPNVVIDSVTVTSSSGTGNDGGGIKGVANLTLTGTSVVKECQAAQDGGCIEIGDGTNVVTLTIEGDTIIEDCTTQFGDGGGAFVDSYSNLVVTGNPVIRNNSAGGGGGGLYTYYGANATLTGGTITGNTAASDGGGLFCYADSTTLPSLVLGGTVKITGNTATGSNGGGVYLSAAMTSITIDGDAEISGNTAGADGGGMYIQSPATISGNASITNNSGSGVFGQGTGALTVTPPAAVTGNTPSNCTGTVSC